MSLRKLQGLDLKNRRVFVRVDFNVPIKKKEGGGFEVGDITRIQGALPTIRHVIEAGGKCILASHLGRPDGKPAKKYSLEPVGQKLSELLDKDVLLTDDCVGDGPRGLSQQMRPGDVMLLENLRFHSGEEADAIEFANKLFELCDVYVSDAFGTLHRAHASTDALPRLAQSKGVGYLVEKELKYLEPLRDNPQRPFALVMGGAKVSDKIGVLEHFMPKVDLVLIGGAMAYSFLKAQGHDVGRSLCDEKQVALAAKLLKGAAARNVKIQLPVDHLIAKSLEEVSGTQVTKGPDILPEWMGVDIGPQTLRLYQGELENTETIFWNGPMGVFEIPAFSNGTFELARIIAGVKARKLVGGGDSAAAIAAAGVDAQFDFISTGGGATLEYLEGKELPGLAALQPGARI